MPPGQVQEAALRERARRLQAVHIRLLFCNRTQKAWRESPDKVLFESGLQPDDHRLFPDIESPQFKAESHGRRIVVERSVSNTFPETQQHITRLLAQSGYSRSRRWPL